MYKKTTMGLAIATILLIAYISGLSLSNQAFAQPINQGASQQQQATSQLAGHAAQVGKGLGQEITQGIEAKYKTAGTLFNILRCIKSGGHNCF